MINSEVIQLTMLRAKEEEMDKMCGKRGRFLWTKYLL